MPHSALFSGDSKSSVLALLLLVAETLFTTATARLLALYVKCRFTAACKSAGAVVAYDSLPFTQCVMVSLGHLNTIRTQTSNQHNSTVQLLE
jgi:hypothetical protein